MIEIEVQKTEQHHRLPSDQIIQVKSEIDIQQIHKYQHSKSLKKEKNSP